MNKRKKKDGSTSTKKFNDGLDYLLELCTDESIQKMYSAAKEVDQAESEDDFGEDFNLALGKPKEKTTKKGKQPKEKLAEDAPVEEDLKSRKRAEKLKEVEKKYFGDDEDFFKDFDADSCEGSDSELESNDEDMEVDEDDDVSDSDAPDEIPTTSKSKKGKKVKFQEVPPAKKPKKLSDSENSDFDVDDEASESDGEAESQEEGSAADQESHDGAEDSLDDDEEESFGDGDDEDPFGDESEDSPKKDKPEEWEDIYGRKRDRAGNLLKEDANKYVPPHLRKALKSTESEDDPKRREKLQNLKRQIKGQINRLAESNLHGITKKIEDFYGKNARHDVNTTLTEVIIDSLVTNVLANERLVLEQMSLIATLHANVGSEIGAFFLQNIVEKFDSMFKEIDSMEIENKQIDNVIFIICHLYTFDLFKHTLIYEILNKLCEKMTEKRVECLLLALRSIGFTLRKDDPPMLREFIIKIQKLANAAGEDSAKNTRVKFMLDILTAVKNNNISKIPQYDPSLVEHFRKLYKQFVRSGNHGTTLAISMQDLLEADKCGKWWLVGSAWAGKELNPVDKGAGQVDSKEDKKRQKIFDLAKKQRMNTDDKRNIFYILMTASDYLEAFEKIVATVKDERTIISVIIHCALSEKEYNPYYSVIAQKFCEHDRKFMLAIQFALWDKIKDINDLSIGQVRNLARLAIFLIENGHLPLSVLKVIEFGQIEKTTLRFLRQVMLGLLLIEEGKFHQIFEKIAMNEKLKSFKDQLRLFMKVFLIKDEKKINISDDQMANLKARIHLADKFLMKRT